MKIIGINGFKQTGKGTVADIFRDITQEGWEGHPDDCPCVVYDVGFADLVKVWGMRALGFDRPPRDLIDLGNSIKLALPQGGRIYMEYDDPESGGLRTLHDLTGREYLQHVGNRARETFGDTFWIDRVLPRPALHPDPVHRALLNQDALNATYEGVDYLLITDLRYENEAQRIKDLGGVVWEVVRPGTSSDGHASEQPLPPEIVDFVIVNDGTLGKLRDRVKHAMVNSL